MDNKYYGVPIPKKDVLMEDLSNMNELIRVFTSDREKLLSVRNTWDVFLWGMMMIQEKSLIFRRWSIG